MNQLLINTFAYEHPIAPFCIPADGMEVFELGGFSFQFAECSQVNAAFSKELHTTLAAVTADIPKAIAAGLLAGYNEGGRIAINFSAVGICRNGIPSGSFDYFEDKTAAHSHFNKDGLEYALDFFGNITYQDEWVGINGYLKPPYDRQPVFMVRIYRKFNAAALDWRNYRFTSIEEAAQVHPLQVKHLQLLNPQFEALPEAVFAFENLEYLTLTASAIGWQEPQPLPLCTISERIGNLACLKSICINHTSLRSLPAGLARLQQLEHLNFSHCELETIPAAIWQLPRLRHLLLDHNRLGCIPDNICLPEISLIDVRCNCLSSLPEALVQQPRLGSLRAQENPLQSLPVAFNAFDGLEISLTDKNRLLDNRYPGADGSGSVEWDDSVYFIGNDEKLFAPIDDIIRQLRLTPHKKALRALLKRAVVFRQTEPEDYQSVGNHRFGGKPDLPAAIAWPEFYSHYHAKNCKYEFLAQINCDRLAPLQNYLPRHGSLFFFLSSMHDVGQSTNYAPANVIYVPDNAALQSGRRFEVGEADFFELMNGQYSPYKASATVSASAPYFYAATQNAFQFLEKAAGLFADTAQMEDMYRFEDAVENINITDHAINAYGFTQNEAPELQAALKRRGNPEDWMILLQLKSRGDFQWGDAGDLFFVAHKSDVAKGDFSNVFVTLEGG